MALDWLYKNRAATAPGAADPAMRDRFFPHPPPVAAAAVRAAIAGAPDWKIVSERGMTFECERTSGVFKFTDDVTIVVNDHPHGSSLGARSVSRAGRGDLGQNRRNIIGMFEAVSVELMDVKPPEGHRGLFYCHHTPHPFGKVTELFFNPAFLPVISPTPPRITLVKKPDPPGLGARMTINLGGVTDWELEFIEWNPPRSFADRQVRGPYESFAHRHSFIDTGDGCVVCDRIHYRMKWGGLGELVSGPLFMGERLARMLALRSENLDRYLDSGSGF